MGCAMAWCSIDKRKRASARLLLWAVSIGALAGSTAIIFRFVAIQLPRLVWPSNPDLVQAVSQAPAWLRIIIPTFGSLCAGLVLMLGARWSGPARGWDILEAVVLRDGVLNLRPALVRASSSILTIASAGAVGREGPMVLLAATVASLAGQRFHVPTRHLRILVGCGVAAGIACAYNTPIGAALFTMEIIVGSFALEVFAPLVFASVVATLISRTVFGSRPVFAVPEFSLAGVWEFVPYLLLGILGGLVAGLFLIALRTFSALFRRSGLPRPIAMASAGLVLGVTILWCPDVVGNGREAIRHLFEQNWSLSLALGLLILRLVLTSSMVGSGAVGGVFTPTLFVGAVLGDAFGSVVHHFLPSLTSAPKAYAVVGMGALLAGTTHAPLTAVVMIFEMTLDYNMVLPLLVAAAAASLIAREVSQESIYTEALRRKRGAASLDEAVMRTLTVRDVMRNDQVMVSSDLPLPKVLDRLISARRNHLYTVDASGCFEGVISLHDVNRALRERENPSSLSAGDIANTGFSTTVPEEHLDRVLERFWVEEAERLPVLDSKDACKLIGTVSQRDILGVYSLEVLHRRSLLTRFQPEDSGPSAATYVELPADHLIEEMLLPPEVIGMTVAESRFRERYGVSVLLIQRAVPEGKSNRLIPDGNTPFQAQDHLTVFGAREKVVALRSLTSMASGGSKLA